MPRNPHAVIPCCIHAIASGAPSTPTNFPPFLARFLFATSKPNILSVSSNNGCVSLHPIYFIPVIGLNGLDWKYLILPLVSVIGNNIASLNMSFLFNCNDSQFGMSSNIVLPLFKAGAYPNINFSMESSVIPLP